MDWSARREHLAGVLATKLLAHYLARGWLQKTTAQRALALTPIGAATISQLFGGVM